jgi:hypothetical protein
VLNSTARANCTVSTNTKQQKQKKQRDKTIKQEKIKAIYQPWFLEIVHKFIKIYFDLQTESAAEAHPAEGQ